MKQEQDVGKKNVGRKEVNKQTKKVNHKKQKKLALLFF